MFSCRAGDAELQDKLRKLRADSNEGGIRTWHCVSVFMFISVYSHAYTYSLVCTCMIV